jgi:3-phenylpropionate/trans-cinnamate dioxygenase ferredoxin component
MCASPPASYIRENPEFEAVALVSELVEGRVTQRILATGEAVCLVRHEGGVSALSDICTHQHFAMSQGDLLHDGTLQCAWHGARFDCRTGEVKQIPATTPLPVYEVRIDGDQVLVGPRSSRLGARYEPSVALIPAAAS